MKSWLRHWTELTRRRQNVTYKGGTHVKMSSASDSEQPIYDRPVCPHGVAIVPVSGGHKGHLRLSKAHIYIRAQPVGDQGVRTPPPIWTDHPNFLDEECDYRYVTHWSARNWVYTIRILFCIIAKELDPQL